MSLTKLVLKRPVTTICVVLCLIVFGISSIFSAKLELIGDFDMPMLVVFATYVGAGPEDVDELVVKPIEDEVSTLSGVDTIMSIASDNMGMVMIEYEYGTDTDQAYDDLKKAVDSLSRSLPDDVGTPSIISMDLNATASLTLAINNDAQPDLYDYVDNTVVPEIEKLSSVASVDIYGGQGEYIKVELIPEKLDQYHLTMNSIVSAISSADFSLPIGTTTVGNRELSVSAGVDFDTMELLKSIPITMGNGNIIYLEDVANIYEKAEDVSSLGRYDGVDTISVSISKVQESTASEVSDDVMKVLADMQADDPNLEVVVISDQSDTINSSLNGVIQTMILAVIVAMVIIFLFFGDIKASLIVGTSIPISILTALILMSAMGYSLNLLTLGGLVLGVGMMVDNSIVVLESCFRNTGSGGKRHAKEYAIKGTQQVIMSILGSTATTCVVFLPLAFMGQMAGQMFRPMGLTIVFSLCASFISAITIVPLCYAFYYPVEKDRTPMNLILEFIKGGYRSLMRVFLKHRGIVMAVSVLLLVGSLRLVSQIDMVLMPMTDEGEISVSIETQPGLAVDKIDDILMRVEDYVAADDDVEHYLASYGSSGLSMSVGSSASVTAYLKDDRSRSTDEVINDWKKELESWPECSITVSANSMLSALSMGDSDTFDFTLVSTQYDDLKYAADQIVDEIRQYPETYSVHSSLENDAPIVKIDIDPVKAAAEGLTPVTVASQVYMIISGSEATTLNIDGNEISVMVEYPDGMYDSIDELQGITITGTSGTVALTDIADIGFEDSPAGIIKTDRQYQATISGTFRSTEDIALDAARTSELTAEFENDIIGKYLNSTIQMQDSTMMQMLTENFSALGTAILTAVFLIFVVMAAQFESPKFSVMVMTTIPMALIGSFSFLWITDSDLSMPALLGFLMLVGTAVNNGILFVDTADQNRRTMDFDTALIEAGATRMRPILMTTLTTIIAMIPMAAGYGMAGELMSGLALVDVGGLLVSMFLSLLVLPVYYSLMTSKKTRLAGPAAFADEEDFDGDDISGTGIALTDSGTETAGVVGETGSDDKPES